MRLNHFLTELSKSADTDINISKNTSDRLEATIWLPDGTNFDFFAGSAYETKIFRALRLNDKKITEKLADKKGLIKWSSSEEKRGQTFKFDKSRGAILSWEIYFEDSDGDTNLKPKGKDIALQLFAALEQVITDFIKSKKPAVFYFGSDKAESSRVKLYKLLTKKIQRKTSYKAIQEKLLFDEHLFIFYKV